MDGECVGGIKKIPRDVLKRVPSWNGSDSLAVLAASGKFVIH